MIAAATWMLAIAAVVALCVGCYYRDGELIGLAAGLVFIGMLGRGRGVSS